MSYTERDYIRRIIERLGLLVRAVLGLRAKGRVDEALVAVDTAAGDLLPVPCSVLDAVDPAAAALLLRDPSLVRTYATLCALRASVLEGDPARSAESGRWWARARALDPVAAEDVRRASGPDGDSA